MSTPSELVLLLLRIGFLLILWFFVFGVVYSLRADLFGMKVRKLPAEAAAAMPAPTKAPASARHPAPHRRSPAPAPRRSRRPSAS